MGWEDVILPRLAKSISAFDTLSLVVPALIDLKSLSPFSFGLDRKFTKALSPNHYEMGCSYDLLRAALLNDPIAWRSACDTYTALLDLHLREIGLWTSEQYTGAPHGGFYLSALVAARMALITARNRDLSIPPQLASDLDTYTTRAIQYLDAAYDPISTEVICCGERMPHGPSAPQQSAFYRELMNIAHPKSEARKISRQIDKPDDYFWLSLRGLRALIERVDTIRSIADHIDSSTLPFTSQRVTIDRGRNGHIAYYTTDRGDGTCAWAEVLNGKVSWGARGSDRPVMKPIYKSTHTAAVSSAKTKIDHCTQRR